MLKRVRYRSDGAVTQSVVVRWPNNLPKTRDELGRIAQLSDCPACREALGVAMSLCQRAKRHWHAVNPLCQEGPSRGVGMPPA